MALKVLEYLNIDPRKNTLALIMNTTSKTYGSKDIVKIEGHTDIDLSVLALVAKQATVNVVQGGSIVKKLTPKRPAHVKNVIKCANPRCVTSSERGLDQLFHLVIPNGSNEVEYRCDYCDEEAKL